MNPPTKTSPRAALLAYGALTASVGADSHASDRRIAPSQRPPQRGPRMNPARTDWFTESATPTPHLRAWFDHEDGTIGSDAVVLLLVQREYPTDGRYRREPGSDWTESRTVFASATTDGDVMPLGDVANFIGLFPAELPVEIVQRLAGKRQAGSVPTDGTT